MMRSTTARSRWPYAARRRLRAASLAAQLHKANAAQALVAGLPIVAASGAAAARLCRGNRHSVVALPGGGPAIDADCDAPKRWRWLAKRIRQPLQHSRHMGWRAGPGCRGYFRPRGLVGRRTGRDPHPAVDCAAADLVERATHDLRCTAHIDRDRQPEPGGGRAQRGEQRPHAARRWPSNTAGAGGGSN